MTSTEGIFLARPDRPPEGVPLAVKDLFDTAGLLTTYGSAVFADHVPKQTAEAVRRLEARGFANVGKTNLHEFAYGTTSENPHYGTVPNPLARGRIAGGSSGGAAAALAADLADAALGTDSGGSIRIPAACCGVVGFKPTYGLVSLEGCFPLAPTFDHAGPMARSVADCTRMLEALADGFTRAPARELAAARVGVAWTRDAEPLVRRRIEEAAALFPQRREIELPRPEGVSAVFMREVADIHRELYAENRELYGENVATKIERCLAIDEADYRAGLRARELYAEQVLAAMEGLDLLVTPTLRLVAPPAAGDELALRESLVLMTFPFNALGWPALALPCGAAEEGLPASVQLIGRTGDDGLVLAVGEALERALEPVE